LKRRFTTSGLIGVLRPVVFAAFWALFPDVAFFVEEGNVVFAFWKAAFQELIKASKGGIIETT